MKAVGGGRGFVNDAYGLRLLVNAGGVGIVWRMAGQE